MPFSTSVCRTAAVRKVEGACRLSCSCGPGQWPGRDVDGQENGAEGPTAFGSGEKRNHPWADWQARSSLEPSALSNHTRPMSWLGPASSGAHPRTKGARFCTGGHRHRLPLTTKGLPVARAAWQATGRPFAEGGRNADQQNARGAARGEATFRSRGRGRPGGTRTRIKKALRAGRPAGHAGHGPRRRRRARLTGNGVDQEPWRPLPVLRRGREAALGAAGFDRQRAFAVRVAAA